MKPVLKVLIGLPASGKSTYAENMRQHGYIIHASDQLRIELYGNVNTFDKNGELFNELHRRVKFDLLSGRNVVLDATNINRKKRMAFLNTISNVDCVKELVIFATPYNLCVQQDRIREKKVGYQVIKNMYMSFQMPLYQEGWDFIKIEYHPEVVLEDNEFDIDNILQRLAKVNQHNEHHKLTIGNHCFKVGSLLLDTGNRELIFAGFAHDIGKEKTASYLNSKGEFTEFQHFYGHQSISAYDTMFVVGNSNVRFPKNRYNTVKVLNYIAEHMQLHLLKDNALEKYKKFVGEEFWNNLEIFHQADIEAKS